MTLRDKLNVIYPELKDLMLMNVGIELQNDLDERGDYIAKWEHPTLARPTEEQLA